jgi:ubiquinone/menaquinone biosynthesis C-methylase UbiE
MAQENVWEREYQNSKLVTKDDKPQNDTLNYFKYLKREKKVALAGLRALDLGCGTGRNSNYLALEGAKVAAIEISSTALMIAANRAKELGLIGAGIESPIEYIKGNMGQLLEFEDKSFDLVIDVTSSNSLNETEREVYIQETHRVLKSGGNFFVKTLCKDGDHNAKNLLKLSPGPETDTYIMPEIGLTERVWSKEDFIAYYSRYFEIEKLEKKTNYSLFNGRSYKRNFWLAYMSKR